MSNSKTAERIFRSTPAGAGARAQFEARVGFVKLGEQEPYFRAVCGEWDKREKSYGSCADHVTLAREFPRLAPLAKWHMTFLVRGPVHYAENATYFARMARGVERAQPNDRPVDFFKSTVVWGALATDDASSGPPPWKFGDDALRIWLAARLPALMAAFRADVERILPGVWAEAEKLAQPAQEGDSIHTTGVHAVDCPKGDDPRNETCACPPRKP